MILVTTKGGKKDRPAQVTFDGSMQWNKSTYLPDMLNVVDYVHAMNEALMRMNASTNQFLQYSETQVKWVEDYAADPVNNPVYHMNSNGTIFWNSGNDNFAQMLQKWAPIQKYTISVNGGTNKTSYYASAGYQNQEGMFKDATDILNRYNFLLKVNVDITDKLQVGASGNYIQSILNAPHRYSQKGSTVLAENSWWEQMTRGEPQILYPIVTPDDCPVGGGVPTEHFYNFLTSGARNITNTETATFSLNAGYDLFKGLKLKGDFAYRATNYRAKDVQKDFGFIRNTWVMQYNSTSPSSVYRAMSHTDYFALNLYADYNLSLQNDHHFNALLGFNQEWSVYSYYWAQKNDLLTYDVQSFSTADGIMDMGDSEWDWAIRGLFMRFKYDYKEKYLFEMNGRYDGTSKFPKASRFAFFPSFSAGWRISGEDFMSSLAPVLSDLKIRASYGSLGNQNVNSNYGYISQFSSDRKVGYIINGERPLAFNTPGLVSSDYTWETATTQNLGIDVGLWNKLTLNFDVYKRTTKDMLIPGEKLPAALGTAVPNRNNANLETKGWELNVKWTDRIANQFRYDIGFVLSDYTATITKFDNNPTKLIANNYVGRKVGEMWGYETVGIIQTKEEAAAAPLHSGSPIGNARLEPGDIQYKKLSEDDPTRISNGDGTVDKPGDRRVIGNTTPRYQFGIIANAQWKGIDFNIFFQGIGKRDFYPTGAYFWGQRFQAAAVGTYQSYTNSWREDNPNAYFPSYKRNSTYNIYPQTRYLQSAAYIRLKNLTIGYTLPSNLTQKIHVNKVRIYGSAFNLWETSKIRGNFDPEIIGSTHSNGGQLIGEYYPLQRSVMCGIQIVL